MGNWCRGWGPQGAEPLGKYSVQTILVDDPGDPRLADFTRLTDVSLRTSLEAEQGLFIAEGTKVISRAVQAGRCYWRGPERETWRALRA